MGELAQAFGLTAGCEVSLEANPDELAGVGAPAQALRDAGVTRLSIGVQSFNRGVLAVLGRSHDEATLETAIDAASRAGFASLSCDLIFAAPGQDMAGWTSDLERATQAGFDHVSTYNLTYEEGTPLTGLRNVGRIAPATDSLERELYECALEHFDERGFEHYEVSSFAKPGHRCRHNLAYWQWRDFLGLGAGAHGFARAESGASGCGRRYENHRAPADYMGARDGEWHAWQETIDTHAAIKELMLAGLRRIDGVEIATLRDVLGPDALSFYPRLDTLEANGLLVSDEKHIQLTREGLLVADSVIESLVSR